MSDLRVAIIGCGPAGLFAAEACYQEGLPYKIYAPRSVSQISGAQYLHEPIRDLTSDEPEGMIDYQKIGTRDGYALKVYGNLHMQVSWDTFDPGPKPYWSLRDAYTRAWLKHEEKIFDVKVSPKDIRQLKMDFGLVVNTAPKKFLCRVPKGHTFTDQLVYLSIPEHRIMNVPNRIVYNGQREVDWYRWSFIQGISCYEFSRKPKWKKKEFIEIHKPLTTDCNCHLVGDYLDVGRFGSWKKGSLTHEAYYKTLEKLDEML